MSDRLEGVQQKARAGFPSAGFTLTSEGLKPRWSVRTRKWKGRDCCNPIRSAVNNAHEAHPAMMFAVLLPKVPLPHMLFYVLVLMAAA